MMATDTDVRVRVREDSHSGGYFIEVLRRDGDSTRDNDWISTEFLAADHTFEQAREIAARLKDRLIENLAAFQARCEEV
jgi:hypothetical protein